MGIDQKQNNSLCKHNFYMLEKSEKILKNSKNY